MQTVSGKLEEVKILMKEYREDSITSIKRYFDGKPTVVDGTIEENCIFENSLLDGYGTIIIDKDFIDDMLTIIDEDKLSTNLIEFLTDIQNKVVNYFYSSDDNNKSRVETYADSSVVNDEGMIIGTKLSSLKGKNIALCSEKSIAVFVILQNLYKKGKLSRRPSMILSYLGTEGQDPEPHAFVLLNRDIDNYPTRHLLFDVENPILMKDINDVKNNFIGLYSLSDEQYNNIINGISCTPVSIFEVLRPGVWQEVSGKRVYGSDKITKQL